MLAKESLDAVFVSIPPGAHRDQVIDVVNAGAAIFVAKPIGLDIQLVERTLAAINKAGVINQVGYMSRYSDMAPKARVAYCRSVLPMRYSSSSQGRSHVLPAARSRHCW